MVDILLLSLQTRFTVIANRLINFLSRIPLIKRVFGPRLYGEYGVKTVLAIFGALFIVIKRVFTRVFYAGFLILMGMGIFVAAQKGGYRELYAALTADDIIFTVDLIGYEIARVILSVWFFFSFTGAFLGAVTVEAGGVDNDRVMVNYLRANTALYAQARIVIAVVSDILLYLPLVIAAFIIGKIPLLCILPMFIMFTAFRLSGEVVNMLFFRLTRHHFGHPPYSFVFVFVLAAALYFPVYTSGIDWQAFLSNPLTTLLSAGIGIASWFFIKRYPLHSEIIREKIGRIGELINKTKARNNSGDMWGNQKDAANWHKNIDAASISAEKHTDKRGFAYLNAVFFDRHSNFFRSKMLVRCLICLAPVVLALALTAYSIFLGDGGFFFEDREIPFNFSPFFFFVVYFASMGRVVTGTVFANCDIHMLHYTYYRTKETTAASFKSRFAVILRYNTIITALMALSTMGAAWLLFGYMDFELAGIFILLLLLIGLFFAFNDLFLYYVIQPYDSTGQSKSIVYIIINFVIYIFAYINMQLRLDLTSYAIFITILTVLYLGTGTILLTMLAPRKFRLR